MQTLKKGKIKLALAIVVLLLAVAVFLGVLLHLSDINTASICNALLYAELPLVIGILLLVLSIRDIKDGHIEKRLEAKRKQMFISAQLPDSTI